jgi:radical SAM superfamily enzyme YgiQ (UPF0313 family)
MSPQILLVTLNSTYQHASFGLRYILANMKELKEKTQILEPTIQVSPKNLVEKIFSLEPKIVGFGVYIWNAQQTLEVVSILKKVAPHITVVLGGPEVSHEAEGQEIVKNADYVIQGEADFLFYEFCKGALNCQWPAKKIFNGPLPEIKEIALPYSLYSDEDIKNRILYVEASRGCPYKCEYCLSSLDKQVRSFDLDIFLGEMQNLIERGAREFKFVDRTFNLSIPTGIKILSFFLERIDLGLFLHFEMVPDRLPQELRELLSRFPAGSLQFEIGIQTWNPEVAKLVSRRNDYSKVKENFQYILNETGIHVHADLIVGLPGETLDSFARGFDELSACGPHEIQVGILKRLKGTPIIRHDKEWEMVYQEQQPFQILKTKSMDYLTLQRMTRFSKYWDLYANSGNFKKSLELFLSAAPSKFWSFLEFSDFLSLRHENSHSLSLLTLAESLFAFLRTQGFLTEASIRDALVQDYSFGPKRRDIPQFLKEKTEALQRKTSAVTEVKSSKTQRQQMHLSLADSQKSSI